MVAEQLAIEEAIQFSIALEESKRQYEADAARRQKFTGVRTPEVYEPTRSSPCPGGVYAPVRGRRRAQAEVHGGGRPLPHPVLYLGCSVHALPTCSSASGP